MRERTKEEKQLQGHKGSEMAPMGAGMWMVRAFFSQSIVNHSEIVYN